VLFVAGVGRAAAPACAVGCLGAQAVGGGLCGTKGAVGRLEGVLPGLDGGQGGLGVELGAECGNVAAGRLTCRRFRQLDGGELLPQGRCGRPKAALRRRLAALELLNAVPGLSGGGAEGAFVASCGGGARIVGRREGLHIGSLPGEQPSRLRRPGRRLLRPCDCVGEVREPLDEASHGGGQRGGLARSHHSLRALPHERRLGGLELAPELGDLPLLVPPLAGQALRLRGLVRELGADGGELRLESRALVREPADVGGHARGELTLALQLGVGPSQVGSELRVQRRGGESNAVPSLRGCRSHG